VVTAADSAAGFAADAHIYLYVVATMRKFDARSKDIGHWAEAFGERPRAEITREDVVTQLAQWREAGLPESALNARVIALRHLYTVLDGKSAPSPAKSVPLMGDCTQMFQFRLTPVERKRLEVAAAANHQNLSEFARLAIVGAAEECLET
jgi:hypothetical protein